MEVWSDNNKHYFFAKNEGVQGEQKYEIID
jgi:hypothetical protein